MTEEIKEKIKSMIDTHGVIASDVADYIFKIEKENLDLMRQNMNLNEYSDELVEQQKDLCGELELYQIENAQLKKGIIDTLKVEIDKTIMQENESLKKKIAEMQQCANCEQCSFFHDEKCEYRK